MARFLVISVVANPSGILNKVFFLPVSLWPFIYHKPARTPRQQHLHLRNITETEAKPFLIQSSSASVAHRCMLSRINIIHRYCWRLFICCRGSLDLHAVSAGKLSVSSRHPYFLYKYTNLYLFNTGFMTTTTVFLSFFPTPFPSVFFHLFFIYHCWWTEIFISYLSVSFLFCPFLFVGSFL